MKRQRPSRTRQAKTAEIELLEEINGRLMRIDDRLDGIHRDAVRGGAFAGAATGAVTGGLVATCFALLRARLGF